MRLGKKVDFNFSSLVKLLNYFEWVGIDDLLRVITALI